MDCDDVAPLPSEPSLRQGLQLRARGAVGNPSGRFERHSHLPFDDGWELEEEERLLATEVRYEEPRSALSYNSSPDLGFDRSINPYRGCEHGCIYCYARPSHAFLNLSPSLDFETKLIVRPKIAEALKRELRAKNYRVAPIALGSNTDPYQPLEAKERVMRSVVELLAQCNHPLGITTRGTLIERDLDLLAPMAAKGLLRVGISITTLDAALARQMEPRAPSPARRLQIITRLAEAGVPVRVMVAPVIPGLTDHELEAILSAAKAAGARYASRIVLRLPGEVEGIFLDWLERVVPDRAGKVRGRLRELHGGALYDPRFGNRFRGQGIWSELLARRFTLAVTRLGFERKAPALRSDLFTRPQADEGQLSLF